MALPTIYHRESFGWPGYYGAASDFVGFDQLYVQTRWHEGVANANLALRGWLNNAFFFAATINQSGRGPVGEQGYAFGNRHMLGLLLPRFGITASATPGGIAFAYNQGGHIGDTLIAEFGTEDGVYLHMYVASDAVGRIIVVAVDDSLGHVETIIGTSDGTVANSGIGTTSFFMPVGAAPSGAGWAPPMVHLEIVPTFGVGTGTVQIKADGQLIMNITGRTNLNPATSDLCGIFQLLVGMPALSPYQSGQTLGDVVLHGANNAGWIGDVSVAWLPVITQGTYTAGTAVGAVAKIDCVSDLGPGITYPAGEQQINEGSDGDTTYVSLDGTGLPKSYSGIVKAFPSDAVDIIEVAPLDVMRKDDGGTSLARVGMIADGTEVDNGSDIAVPTGYTPKQFGRTTNPATSAAWTADAVIEVVHRRVA